DSVASFALMESSRQYNQQTRIQAISENAVVPHGFQLPRDHASTMGMKSFLKSVLHRMVNQSKLFVASPGKLWITLTVAQVRFRFRLLASHARPNPETESGFSLHRELLPEPNGRGVGARA